MNREEAIALLNMQDQEAAIERIMELGEKAIERQHLQKKSENGCNERELAA